MQSNTPLNTINNTIYEIINLNAKPIKDDSSSPSSFLSELLTFLTEDVSLSHVSINININKIKATILTGIIEHSIL